MKKGFKGYNPNNLKFPKWKEERQQLVDDAARGKALLAVVQVNQSLDDGCCWGWGGLGSQLVLAFAS